MLFTSPKKQVDFNLKIKLNGKQFYEVYSFKYLGTQIDKRLRWKQQINHMALKLNKTNAMLSKLRHDSHLFYTLNVWAQKTNY